MATLYFKSASGSNWHDLSLWYQNSNFTIPATSLPTSNDDVIISQGGVVNIGNAPLTTINSLTIQGSKTTPGYSLDVELTNSRWGRDFNPTLNVINNIILNNVGVALMRMQTGNQLCKNIILNGPSYLFMRSLNVASCESIILNNSSEFYPLYDFNLNCNIVANDYSSIVNMLALFVGNITLNDYSSLGYVDDITGNITFNDNSQRVNTFSRINNITGNLYYPNSSYTIDATSPVKLAGGKNAFFTSSNPVSFTINNSNVWDLNTSSWTFTNPSPSWTFNNSSYQTGNTTFPNSSTITFNNNSHQDGNITNGNITFNNNSYQNGNIINANVTYGGLTGYNNSIFYNGGQIATTINIPIAANETSTFNNRSVNLNTITGNVEFNDNSLNLGTITGDASFNDDSSNYNPKYPAQRGTVTGNTTCNSTLQCPYAPGTLYFNGAADGDWNNLNNWWVDTNCTTQSTSLPTVVDSVVASASISSNSGNTPTVVDFTMNGSNTFSITINVSGTATFNDYSQNSGGTINGNAIFNSYSSNYATINGNATFNNDSYLNGGTVNGNASFNNNSFNYNGNITGNVSYNGYTGFNWTYNIYFIGGQQTSLDSNGNGNWNNIYYIYAQATTLDSNGSGYWNGYYYIYACNTYTNGNGFDYNCTYYYLINGCSTSLDMSGNGYDYYCTYVYYISGQQTSLDSNGNGNWNNIYYIYAQATTLDSNGSGYWNGYYYIYAQVTTLDSNGNGLWNGYPYYNGSYQPTGWNGYYYYIDNTETTLGSNGNGYWSGNYYLNGSILAQTGYYFNAAEDNNWGNLNNWWITNPNLGTSVHPIVYPTGSDNVIILGTCNTNSGDPATANNLTINNTSYFGISITVSSTITFNDSSTADFVFNDNQSVAFNGFPIKILTMSGVSQNSGYLRLQFIRAGLGVNGSSILGIV